MKTEELMIDFDNLDMGKFRQVRIYADEGGFYTAIVYSKSLKRNVRLVVFQPKDGKHILYFSTDTNMSAKNVEEYYRTRFQIEFCYRDGKQFAGLCNCQARDFAKLDFAFNASLAAVNVAKVVIKEHYPTFSMANLKSLLHNAYIMNRFFCHVGFPSERCENRAQSRACLSFAEVEPAQRALSTARIKINKRKTSAKRTSQ